MANNKVSIYLTLRRFRRRIKSQNKRNKRKKQRSFTLENNRKYREIAKLIHSYEDALLYFMPRNLSYLTQNEKSPFYVKNLEKEKFKSKLPKLAY